MVDETGLLDPNRRHDHRQPLGLARDLPAGVRKATANPEYFLAAVFECRHRLALLLLPIVGLSLALVYRNRPRIFI